MKKPRISIALILGAIVVSLLTACGGSEPPATATATPLPRPTNAPATRALQLTPPASTNSAGICANVKMPGMLTNLVLARATDGQNYTPVGITDTFPTSQQTLNAVATLENAPAGTRVRAVWYLLHADGYKSNQQLEQTELDVPTGGSRNVAFMLRPASGKFPPGTYCVELYLDGVLSASKPFEVTDEGGASSAPVNPVKQVVMAEDVNPTTFEPVNPTATFKANAPRIHAVVQVEGGDASIVYRARFYPPNMEPLDKELTKSASPWLDFFLTPTDTGFPTGDYKVEIYVNDRLVDTKSFTVE